MPGKQPAGFELNQCGGDQQELGRDLKVKCLQTLDFGQIGINNGCQLNFVEVDLLFEDELDQKVKRPLVHRCLNSKRHTLTLVPKPIPLLRPSTGNLSM